MMISIGFTALYFLIRIKQDSPDLNTEMENLGIKSADKTMILNKYIPIYNYLVLYESCNVQAENELNKALNESLPSLVKKEHPELFFNYVVTTQDLMKIERMNGDRYKWLYEKTGDLK